MLELELVRRRRARRILRRRADLLVALATTVAVLATVAVTLRVVDDSAPADRAPTEAGAVPSLLGLGGSAGPGDDPTQPPESGGSEDDPDAEPVAATVTRGGDAEPAAGAIEVRTPIDESPEGPAADPLAPVPPRDPAEPERPQGPLTRLVDPLLARVVGLVPILGPVRETVREVTTCADAATSPTPDEAGTACAVPASP